MMPNKTHASTDPREIKKVGNGELHIVWGDGHKSVYEAKYLRQNCPCACCIDERTGELRIAPGSIAQSVELLKVDMVGRYALRFAFSDGHNTGIYSFENLRKLCSCPDCVMMGMEN